MPSQHSSTRGSAARRGRSAAPAARPAARLPSPPSPPSPPPLPHLPAPATRRRPHDRDAILDAAENAILRDGIGSLTLDAVAAEAGLSKSGLLHHYRSKDALIDAMVRRAVEGWRDEMRAAIESQAPGPGRVSRATLATCLGSASNWTAALRRRGWVLVAALVHNPAHVQPLRDVVEEMEERIAADALPAGAGEVVRLVTDGLWFGWIFGIAEPTAKKLEAIRTALRGLMSDRSGLAGGGRASPRRAAGAGAKGRGRGVVSGKSSKRGRRSA